MKTPVPPRTDDDELDEEAFATELRRRVEALIDAD